MLHLLARKTKKKVEKSSKMKGWFCYHGLTSDNEVGAAAVLLCWYRLVLSLSGTLILFNAMLLPGICSQ